LRRAGLSPTRTGGRGLHPENYSSALAAGLYGNPVMYFANVDGLTVTDNRQPMSGGKFVGYANSTSVTVAGNRTN
jgi:hypothetical protein